MLVSPCVGCRYVYVGITLWGVGMCICWYHLVWGVGMYMLVSPCVGCRYVGWYHLVWGVGIWCVYMLVSPQIKHKYYYKILFL